MKGDFYEPAIYCTHCRMGGLAHFEEVQAADRPFRSRRSSSRRLDDHELGHDPSRRKEHRHVELRYF
ncbi:Uncharacterised protein [Bacteroides xylanisolvens]|nr:Uncharacterised protein [Bacteroides xylanisolvens]